MRARAPRRAPLVLAVVVGFGVGAGIAWGKSPGKGRRVAPAAPRPAAPAPAAPPAAAPVAVVDEPPPADTSTRQRAAKVVAVSAERVFLSLGRADGVAAGARVRAGAGRGAEVIGVVDALSARRASFALPGAPSRVRPGDTLLVGVGAREGAEGSANPTTGPTGSAADLFGRHLASPTPAPPLLVAAVDKNKAPVKRKAGPAPTSSGVHGSAGISVLYVKDLPTHDPGTMPSAASLQPLDFFQARIDSRLYGNDLASGHLRYDHRLSAQYEGLGDLRARPGWDGRRWVRADWIALTYLPVAGGPYQITAGRILPVGYSLAGPTDGGRLGYFGRNGGVSLTAGLAPQATDLRPDYRSARAAVDAFVAGKLGKAEARAELSSWAALTDGQIDRVALSLALQVRYGRRFGLFGYAEGGWLPDDLRAALATPTAARGGPPITINRDAISLDRVHAFATYTPAALIDIQVRYAFDRPVIDRTLLRLFPREYLLSSPRHAAGATVRLRAGPVTLEPFGDLDLSADTGLRYRAGGRIHLDRFPFLGTRITLTGQYTEGSTLTLYTAGVRLSQQLTSAWDLYGGYTFSLVEEHSLDERYSMHSGDVGLQVMFARRFAASVEGSGDFGPFGTTLAGFGRLGVWF